MHALQQKCRPKHQVLILKCYPRTTKGAVDVKPNSSELSYLLFYATSRKTKISKVGKFLEKKTASDVYHQRIGNVQVTLQILEALIEKSPKDLPLVAPSVLTILDEVLRSNDITMIESSLPTFDAFCQNHDASSLFADQVYLRQYENVVKQYASLASTQEHQGRIAHSKPVALRWRNAGLEAIKSIASSDALSSIAGRQIDVVVPMILENLWTDNEEFIDRLLHRTKTEEKVSTDELLRRRTSTSTVRTTDAAGEPNPIALSGTAGDVDKLAEEDTGVLALQCLKQIFVVPNRQQIYGATTVLLRFIEERVQQNATLVRTSNGTDSGWAIKLFRLVSRWAPMQERYVILVTTTDTMVRTPLKDGTLRHHLVLTAMIGSLLRSDVNLIGLSVMDVMLGLIQHMKRLVQLPGDPTGGTGVETGTPAAQRQELLGRIQQTMGDLATHVYYNEQIIDMVSALLTQLKPSKNSATTNTTPRGEQTDAGTKGSDDSHLGSLVALTISKITALRAVKTILKVANPKVRMSGNISLSRYTVPIEKWEGTQWLLRDPDGEVRKAYADALLTWLDRETKSADLVAHEDLQSIGQHEPHTPTDNRRSRPSATYRERPGRKHKSLFLHLLHIAIYDNALQYLDYDSDIVLLHILLTKLVNRLGVNAVRFGLPMVFRLQEDIQDAETPLQKVRLGSLCHGYFWALTEKFNFDATVVGSAIQNEIIRRRTKHFWVEGIQVPTPPLEKIGTPGIATEPSKLSVQQAETEALLPFDDRLSLVECICTSYQDSVFSPPTSPAASPSHTLSQPILGSGFGTTSPANTNQEVPSSFKETMLFDWSRESAMATIQAASKSASLNGSRSGTNGPGTTAHWQMDTGKTTAITMRGRALFPVRSSNSPRTGGHSSPDNGVKSVSQLKMILSGEAPAPPLTGVRDISSSEDSMVSYDMSASEMSFNPPRTAASPSRGQANGSPPVSQRSRSISRERKGSDGASLGPLTLHRSRDSASMGGDGGAGDDVPPVPPLPSGMAGASPTSHIARQDYANTQSPISGTAMPPLRAPKQRSIKSRGNDTIRSSTWSIIQSPDEPLPTMDLQSLLKGIDSRAGESSLGNVTKPPY
ncbi:plasma membrane localization protein [Cytospora paraplurivora]|uniref:Plasma membrane localization protein n=1 Tax=Cytospora paraplurivora TaxID=2898453 RepID=A0AAN9U954_9PEZI